LENKISPIIETQNCKEFELLKKLILKKLGLQCSYYRDSYPQRRINFRMKKVESSNYMDYIKRLGNDPEEYTELIREITVNYTKFFRDEDVFSFFSKKHFA
jgi:chemotaxis methyl-accepting protein methylase